MTDRDAFAERGRSLEEEYFHRKEREVIDKMRVRAAADEQRRRLGEKAGVADEEVLSDLQALGYTPETVMMLYLVPLIQTAWAEGGVSPERARPHREGRAVARHHRGHAVRSAAEHVADDAPIRRDVREIAARDPHDSAGAAGRRARRQRKGSAVARHGHRRPRQAASSDSARSRQKSGRFSRTSATS